MILKQQKLDGSSKRTISAGRLREKMSEVISLREKVAQAELAKLDIGDAISLDERYRQVKDHPYDCR
jgi:hypothetical protein